MLSDDLKLSPAYKIIEVYATCCKKKIFSARFLISTSRTLTQFAYQKIKNKHAKLKLPVIFQNFDAKNDLKIVELLDFGMNYYMLLCV